MSSADRVRCYATLTFVRGALVSVVIALLAGAAGVLFYIPGLGVRLADLGIGFSALRPLHTTFASAWIFLGGVAVVHHYLQSHGGIASKGDRRRLRWQVLLWAIAGLAVLGTLPFGITSGREYMGFHPAISLAILAGWLLFAWNFFRVVGPRFWHRPVYVTMWAVAVLFFIYTFVEQHLWLLPGIFSDPIVDLRLQWKATGTLIGSFNLFVYGALYYIGEQVSGDRRYAHSKTAYALLAVGLLNSFTNYGHHTYHIPQSEIVKWVSFVVSLTESIILARVVWDIARQVSQRHRPHFEVTRFFLNSARWWTCAMLFSAVLISIPPLNGLIHGTQVVTAHAMGTEIGIDSMVLFAAISWMLGEVIARRGCKIDVLSTARMRWVCIALNVFAALLILWLHVSGSIVGLTRYQHLPPPEWLRITSPYLFAVTGLGTALCIAILIGSWLRLAFRKPGSVMPIEPDRVPPPAGD